MLKILLCEDDDDQMDYNQEYIENLLKKKKTKFEIESFRMPDRIKRKDMEWCNVAFLDIDYGEKNKSGIQLAREILKINKWVAVVFITAYQEYTCEAFQLQAFGYLEKPLVRYEVDSIIDKIKRYVSDFPQNNFLHIIHNKKHTIINQRDIVFVEKEAKKAIISTITKDIDTYEKIAEIEKKLCEDFLKINQGVIVNKNYICNIEDEMVCLSTGKKIKISRSRLKEAMKNLTERRDV